ncbi:MAG: glycosyltransferase [Pseudomonadota bacterium]
MAAIRPLRIVHIMRAPMGGVFRHVRDLAQHHSSLGHAVGIICDEVGTPGYHEDALSDLSGELAMGVHRIAMPRAVGLADIGAAKKVLRALKELNSDVVHGHGAKGGVYARAVGRLSAKGRKIVRAYSPHGGSLHFDPTSRSGKIYFTVERLLERQTDALMFVARYEQDTYGAKIGEPTCPTRIVYNGLAENEFVPVKTVQDPVDFLFIGEIRDLKGFDLVIEAARRMVKGGHSNLKILMVGSGPDEAKADQMIKDCGLEHIIRRKQPMPARDAFAQARSVVMPSRAEAMPYIVLEALGAGMPIIASKVGGIPEIFSDNAETLISPRVEPLEAAMRTFLEDPAQLINAMPSLATLKSSFSIETMGNSVLETYQKALAR